MIRPTQADHIRRINNLRQAIADGADVEEITRRAALLARDSDDTDITVDPAEIASIIDSLRPRFPVFSKPELSVGDGTPPMEAILRNALQVTIIRVGSWRHVVVGHEMAVQRWERITGRPIGD